MTLFSNLTNEGLEEAQDRLGGGFQVKETDVYEATIKVAYAGQSSGGARNVTIVADIDGSEYSETIYITNKQGQNWFPNRQDPTKKVPLPGFTTVDDICIIATGSPLAEQPTEDKLVEIWDYDAKKKLPKSVPVLTALIGQKVGLAILKQTVDINEKDASGNYNPTGKTRDENVIEKAFDIDSRLTVVEATKGLEASFIDKWVEKNKGQVRDRTAKNDNQGTRTGRPGNNGGAPQAGARPAGKSLFGNKAVA